MFEKFTEKAINVVTEAQTFAKEMSSSYVQPEHLLLAIINQAKGIPLKLFRMYGVKFEDVKAEVEHKLRFEKTTFPSDNVAFSDEFKKLLKNTLDLANNSGNSYVLFEHLFIAIIIDETSYVPRILEKTKFDINNAVVILKKVVQKKTKKMLHPEAEDTKEQDNFEINTDTFFEDETSSRVFSKALELMSDANYELLGTEQLFLAILDSKDIEVTKLLEENGVNLEKFNENLQSKNERNLEYDNKKILFTPSAYCAMEKASLIAKELGSPIIKPEHFVLGILESKKGVVYNILKKMVTCDELSQEIIKPIEKQMPEALTILKLARQEARRLGRNVVGSEMILLGIITEGTGIGFKVLNDLGITLKEARLVIENIIGFGNEYYDLEITFTKRAKKMLEIAWQKAKKYNRPRILSEHLLYAITTDQSSVAMKALEVLGVDAVEIRQGILKEIEQ